MRRLILTCAAWAGLAVAAAAGPAITNSVWIDQASYQYDLYTSRHDTRAFWFYFYTVSTNAYSGSGYTGTLYWASSSIENPDYVTNTMNSLAGTVVTNNLVMFSPTTNTFTTAVQKAYSALVLTKGTERITYARGHMTIYASPESP